MPRIPFETFSRYRWDNAAAGWRSQDQPELVLSTEEASNGDVFQRGDRLYRASDSAFLARIATVRGADLLMGSEGSMMVRNSIRADRVGDSAGFNSLYQAEVSVQFQVGSEGPSIQRTGTTSLSEFGGLPYIAGLRTDGRPNVQNFQLAAGGRVGAPERIGQFRLATSQEMVTRGVIGWLARNMRDEIDQLAVKGITLPDGSTTTDGSEIVKLLAQQLTVTPLVTYVLKGTIGR